MNKVFGIFGGKVGWKMSNEVVVGDKLFDEEGKPCNVISVEDSAHSSFVEIGFTDNISVTVPLNHYWCVWSHRARKQFLRKDGGRVNTNGEFPPKNWSKFSGEIFSGKGSKVVGHYGTETLTTQEVIDRFNIGKRGDNNWCIPLTKPLELSEKSLPIDPYCLSLWLGDGCKSGGSFCIGEEDLSHYTESIKSFGYSVSDPKYLRGKTWSFRVKAPFIKDMQSVSSKEKAIPYQYLTGSIEQRLSFLQGFLDSDGYSSNKTVEFCSMRRDHADSVLWVVRSLGERPTMSTGRAKLNGKDFGEKYRVFWKPSEKLNQFRLKRKADNLDYNCSQKSRGQHRMMKSFKIVDGLHNHRKIVVDSPSGLYLLGEGLVPSY